MKCIFAFLVLVALLCVGSAESDVSMRLEKRFKSLAQQSQQPITFKPQGELSDILEDVAQDLVTIEDVISTATGNLCLPGICSSTAYVDMNGRDMGPCTSDRPCRTAQYIINKYRYNVTESRQMNLVHTCGNFTSAIEMDGYFWITSIGTSRCSQFGGMITMNKRYCHTRGSSGQGAMAGLLNGFQNFSSILIDCTDGTVSNLWFVNSFIMNGITTKSNNISGLTTFILNSPNHGPGLHIGGTQNYFSPLTQAFLPLTFVAYGPSKLNAMDLTIQPVAGNGIFINCVGKGNVYNSLLSGVHWNGEQLGMSGTCGKTSVDIMPIVQNLGGNVITNLMDGTSIGFTTQTSQGFSGVTNANLLFQQLQHVSSGYSSGATIVQANVAPVVSASSVVVGDSAFRVTGQLVTSSGIVYPIMAVQMLSPVILSVPVPVPLGKIVHPSVIGSTLVGSFATLILPTAQALNGRVVLLNSTSLGVQIYLPSETQVGSGSVLSWTAFYNLA